MNRNATTHGTIGLIEGLCAGFVGPAEFSRRLWFRGSRWYYHLPTAMNVETTDVRCYPWIDADLRDICRLLHSHGIRTTPSCQGHFYPAEYYAGLWQFLLEDRRQIHEGGLVVRESACGQAFLFRDHNDSPARYVAPEPWARQRFSMMGEVKFTWAEQVMEYQSDHGGSLLASHRRGLDPRHRRR